MPEASLIMYSFKELATLMVKDRDIHEGLWGLYFRFGIRALNAGETNMELRPTAVVPILEVGLQQFPELNNLSVDAAEVNPLPSKSKKATKKANKKRAVKK